MFVIAWANDAMIDERNGGCAGFVPGNDPNCNGMLFIHARGGEIEEIVQFIQCKRPSVIAIVLARR
jgi:hypothetical protein